MRKPIIGINCGHQWEIPERFYVNDAYIHNVVDAGGVPILIPFMEAPNLDLILDMIDGLLIPGGIDIDAKYFNQELHPKSGRIDPLWDQLDIMMIAGALERNLPILAICRGCQILNVACGGTLIQDIASFVVSPLKHEQQAPKWYGTHKVQIKEKSLLATIFNENELAVNSFHHQAVGELAPNFQVSAIASDGVIEAIESKDHSFVLGLQWHPELMVSHDAKMKLLFTKFVTAAVEGGR